MRMNGTKVEIFDLPMCCPTGLCGPTIDPVLLDVNEMVLELQTLGVQVERYQMATQPQAFMANAEVFRLVREQQLAALPITAVNGQVIKVGDYPSLDEIREAINGDGLGRWGTGELGDKAANRVVALRQDLERHRSV